MPAKKDPVEIQRWQSPLPEYQTVESVVTTTGELSSSIVCLFVFWAPQARNRGIVDVYAFGTQVSTSQIIKGKH